MTSRKTCGILALSLNKRYAPLTLGSLLQKKERIEMAYQIERAEKRDHKRSKAKNGMRVSNRSIFTIVGAQVKRSEEIKKKKK